MLQSWLPTAVAALPLRPLVVVVTVVAVLAAVRRLAGRRLAAPLRRRLLLGLPWGTLLTMALVAAIYLFVQGAWWHPRPLVTPFRTWSYFYPLGMVTGAFTHGSVGHVTGNLLGTLVFGTVVEYAWGHYPQRRGVQSFTGLRTNPFARILAVPAAMIAVGLFTGLFAIGPVVGFSGVVFALGGFALVARPYLFLGALLASRAVDQVYVALRFPQPTVGGSTRFVTPWWADIAIQGHAIGLLAGVLLAGALTLARDEPTRPARVFFAALVYAVSRGLWAVYVPVGGGEYTLYRWLGTGLVFLLALLVATATARRGRDLVPEFERDAGSLATLAVVVALCSLCLAAVPANLATIEDAEVPDEGIEVEGYTVAYAEDVRNEYAASIWTPLGIGESRTNISTSGVIVANADREIWIRTVPKGRLAVNQRATVVVGGVGWREPVYANRSGWNVLGNDTVYRVQLRRAGGPRRTAYTSPPSTADATVAGRNVTLRAAETGFRVAVSRGNETIATGPLPANMSSRSVGGLTIERNRTRIYASTNDTRVRIARARRPPD
ncbi:rhomboid family intramembrane serine protease [Haloarcula litorea]|uniref:rhomboid family intramembrane serine protease n=1 Tax=Haloarcula litorea TaxID=3032579 RepID=UPI0023E8FA68|nr:rhomboid family intramembrane serine protease [Halomicroarcula sp. GDY20]